MSLGLRVCFVWLHGEVCRWFCQSRSAADESGWKFHEIDGEIDERAADDS